MRKPIWLEREFSLFPNDREKIMVWFNELLDYVHDLEQEMKILEKAEVVVKAAESIKRAKESGDLFSWRNADIVLEKPLAEYYAVKSKSEGSENRKEMSK